MRKLGITNQLVAGLTAAISVLGIGFHYGWSAVSLPKLLAADSDIPITTRQSSWIVGSFIVGSALGSLIAAALVDKCGRKLSLLLTVIPQFSACIFIACARSLWWLVVARFMAGVAGGSTYTVVPMYTGEIADDKTRGVVGILLSIILNSGIFIAYSVGPWINREAFASLGGALALLFGLTFVWMPESPYFSVMKQNLDDAKKSLSWLRGTENVEQELNRVRENGTFNEKNSGTVKELVMVPGNRKALIIVLGLSLAQQLSGISVILSYISLIFEASGSSLDSRISVIIIGAVKLLSGVLTIPVIDSVGRRPLLLFSACGSALFLGENNIDSSMFVTALIGLSLIAFADQCRAIINWEFIGSIGEALYFQLLANGVNVSAISWLPITATTGYMICYAVGLSGIPHVIISEIFPCNAKALATMSVTEVLCLGGFVATVVYQTVADRYGIHVCFWVFTGITVLSAIFIYFTLPETKQRSLESIQAELHKTADSTVSVTNKY